MCPTVTYPNPVRVCLFVCKNRGREIVAFMFEGELSFEPFPPEVYFN